MATLAEAKKRHADHYLTQLGQLEEQDVIHERAEALERFDRDWTQIAAAHAWVADQVADDQRSFLFFQRARTFLELRRSIEERLHWLDAAERLVRSLGNLGLQAEFHTFRGNLAYEAGNLASAGDW